MAFCFCFEKVTELKKEVIDNCFKQHFILFAAVLSDYQLAILTAGINKTEEYNIHHL